jgi:hypothetical protein
MTGSPAREEDAPQAPGASIDGRRENKALGLLAAGALVLLTVALVGGTLTGKSSASGSAAPRELLPDLRTIVPVHLNLVNQQGHEYLRFSNGIANTGGGPWAVRPENELGTTPTTVAWQEIRSSNDRYLCGTQPKPQDPCYTIASEQPVSSFEYHPTHNHWHTADVARFEVRTGSPTGPVVGGNSTKVGFCLIDLYSLDGKSPTSGKVFWDCYRSYQGISVGWVDQYHHATDGQQVDLLGVDNGDDYYLVSTADPDDAFLEQDDTNNTAWVRFTLSRSSNGNRKVTVTGNSPCGSPALCGVGAPNRG